MWEIKENENDFIRKLSLISKFMSPQTGKQTVTIHILRNISRSKGNQAIKLSQLIEYKIRDAFLENHTQKLVEKLVPKKPFIKKWKSCISLNQQSEMLCSLFLFHHQVEDCQNLLNLRC